MVPKENNFADRSLGPSSKGVADAPRERLGIGRWEVTFWTKRVTHLSQGLRRRQAARRWLQAHLPSPAGGALQLRPVRGRARF